MSNTIRFSTSGIIFNWYPDTGHISRNSIVNTGVGEYTASMKKYYVGHLCDAERYFFVKRLRKEAAQQENNDE